MKERAKVCNRKDCADQYQYGVAPHECYWQKPGGFANPLGASTIEPLENWPDNFLAEIDPARPVSEQLKWGLCGVYYCPECRVYMEETETLWGRQRIIEALKREAAGVYGEEVLNDPA